MIEGRTLTKHFHIETKQHELFNYDLGEGVPRRMLVFGVVTVLAWIALLAPILGSPNKLTFSVYAIPPVIFAYYAFRDSEAQPRRKNLTQWVVQLRYATVGHRPVVRLGARAAYRSEYLPLGERVRIEGLLRKVAPAWFEPQWALDEDDDAPAEIRLGRPIVLDQGATLYGFDHMHQLRTRQKKGKGTRS